ncbi:RNA polymerase sigma factor for flagellar operon FliA [Saccharothrix tamanrassetensis]|uniref:RNA polymerase sigma factor n=1 Tax=Saccharothrix tamanrassetensis TaxID=1051531 RepID=A0A841CEZ3_9PSEU|nr:FliA/WhiG family RNA polymerase sigma factor [Saccharothrix tamanrassetensis]MBB5955550.1 RNA polymerase sigma factor for flagellar operon FliA [Saccharothrix tamanrassetensis]
MTSPAAAHVGTSSEAQNSAAHAPTGTNGHHVDEPTASGHDDEPLQSAPADQDLSHSGRIDDESRRSEHAVDESLHNGHPVTAPVGRPAHPASESRTADDVEAGIIALWHTYGQSHEQFLRDRLVLHYAPLVKYVAGRVGTGLPAHVDVADLIQSGIFGLVDAIEKFEPERGLKFETYAMQRIRGAILDDLRSQDWVPRSVRSRARDVERALERLGASLQRTPTDRELAVELKIGLAELRELYAQLQLTSVVALDELIAAGRSVGGAGASLAESLPDEGAEDPIATLVDQDSRRQLADAIAQLAERDRVVVTLYYFENLTLAEIGKVLGVTESRVCQLHTRAVLRLRTKLNEQLEA